MPAIISAAEVTDAVGIHPGYGFLSENADAERVEKSGKALRSSARADVIRMMGDKGHQRDEEGRRALRRVGWPADGPKRTIALRVTSAPVITKASGGGGGRGMRVVHTEASLLNAIAVTKSEAHAALTTTMEKF